MNFFDLHGFWETKLNLMIVTQKWVVDVKEVYYFLCVFMMLDFLHIFQIALSGPLKLLFLIFFLNINK